MKKFFAGIDNAEDLKKEYFRLAKMFHSDLNGGSDETMKQINAEYDELFRVLRNVHKSTREETAGQTYTAEKETSEVPEDFIGIVSHLLKLDGLNIELVGRWIWISGQTMKHKDALKACGCRWSSSKKMWSWHYSKDDTPYHKREISMKEIRNKYGSEMISGIRPDLDALPA